MTENEINSVTILQQRGLGYKRIAAITLLPVNTVKSYVSRHPAERADVCLQCGVPLSQQEHRKEKILLQGVQNTVVEYASAYDEAHCRPQFRVSGLRHGIS